MEKQLGNYFPYHIFNNHKTHQEIFPVLSGTVLGILFTPVILCYNGLEVVHPELDSLPNIENMRALAVHDY